jgi:P27 family predicted phage terminase small subunit
MPGPSPKPGGRRQRRNKSGGTGGLQLKPRLELSEVPAPPKHWLATTRTLWEDYWISDVARLVESGSDSTALTRLFTLYDERERAYRAFRKERLVEGSTGQRVINPLWKAAAIMDAEIRALEDRFGVTPSARLKLGIQFGEMAKNLEDLNAQLNQDEGERDDDASDARLKITR